MLLVKPRHILGGVTFGFVSSLSKTQSAVFGKPVWNDKFQGGSDIAPPGP